MSETSVGGEQKPPISSVRLNDAVSYNVHFSDTLDDQLIRSARRMTRLLAVLPGGVIVLNGDGIIQQSNAAVTRLLGVPLDGQAWTTVIERAFQPQVNKGHDLSLNDGRLVHISTSPLEDEPGQIVLVNDVSETRQLQKQVSHLERLSSMGEMAARLAHQIRTPLSIYCLVICRTVVKRKYRSTVNTTFC